jgi:hypothetical protein
MSRLPKNSDKSHRIYTFSSTDSCDDIKSFMLSRIAFLNEGYPKTTKEGKILFNDKLWNKCKKTLEDMNFRSFTVPTSLFPRPIKHYFPFDNLDVPVSVLIDVNPILYNKHVNYLNWYSSNYKGGKWKEEYELATQDDEIEIGVKEKLGGVVINPKV